MPELIILGCGTSGGVPRAPLHWGACDPQNPKNRRRRASVLFRTKGVNILVDTSPDLREQCLANDINHIDAVFYSHDHADHVHGIDDLRGFWQESRQRIPIYADDETLATLQQRFDYIFHDKNGYPALCNAHRLQHTQSIAGVEVRSFKQAHGTGVSRGFRFANMAYSTDVSGLDDAAFAALQGVDIWVVDALRYKPHPTHAHLDLTLEWIERVKPRLAVLTHLAWDMDYATLKAQLPEGVIPAYDGMRLQQS